MKEISKAQAAESKSFGEMLDEANGKGNVFRIAKQIIRKNEDVVGGGCVRDSGGKIVVDDIGVREVWRKHFDKLMNEEFDRDKNCLQNGVPGSGSAE